MSNSEIEQSGTVKGHLPNEANLSGRISNGLSLSGHISIGSGAGDFIIKMMVEGHDEGYYTVTSCDATIEQIDAAVVAEKRVVVIATDTTSGGFWELPIVQAFQGQTYIFIACTYSGYMISTVYKSGENEIWEFVESHISAESVGYYNSTQPDVETVLVALNKLFTKSHTHANKSVLDKFSETDGKPTYDGKKISGASTAEEVEYTNAILPDASNVKSALDDTIDTQQTQSADIESLRSGVSALMDAYQTQGGDIASLKTQAHTHANKDTLDKLSVSNGKLQYNGSDVGLKGADGKDGITPTIGANGNWYLDTTDTGKPSRGEKGDKGDPGSDANVTKANVITALGYTPEAVSAQVTTGSNITLADNTEYRLTDVTELSITYPDGNFECWMRLAFAADGTITVTLPSTTQYIGTTPTFANGETWEMSIKDGIVIARKVGDGA